MKSEILKVRKNKIVQNILLILNIYLLLFIALEISHIFLEFLEKNGLWESIFPLESFILISTVINIINIPFFHTNKSKVKTAIFMINIFVPSFLLSFGLFYYIAESF